MQGTDISSILYGGTGMNFDGLSEQAVRTSFIRFCFFHKNKANNGMGNDVRINGDGVTSNPFFESYSTTTEKRVWFKGTSDSDEYNGWLPVGILLLTRYVHQNGNDMDELCGMNETTPCRTIEHVFGNLRNDVECKVFLLESSFAPSSALSISSQKVKVIGNGTNKSVISTSMLSSSVMLFTINSGNLRIFSLTIDHNTESETVGLFSISDPAGAVHLKHLLITSTRTQTLCFCNPLFDIGSGSISIESCKFSDFRINTQLIKAPISSFSEISNTNFTEIIRSSGNGGVIECNVSNREVLTLNNISFDKCKCESGNGGCLSILMQVESKARLGEIDSLTFTDCNAQGTGNNGFGGAIFLKLENSASHFVFDKVAFINCHASQFGNNIFIEAANLSQVINAERLKFSPQLNVLTDLCGYENGDRSFAIPLVLYLQSKPSEFYVGNANKRDWYMCGFADEQCSTVDYVFLQHKTSSGVSIAVDGSSTLSREISLSEGTTSVRGIRAQTQLIIKDNSTTNQDGMIISRATTSFLSIQFYLPSSLSGREALFLVQSGSFSCEQCVLMLTSSTTLSYGFIISTGGTSMVKSLMVKGFTLTEAPLMISHTNGLLNIELCNISNTTATSEEGIIKCSNGGSLTLQNSTMEGIVCSSKAAISIENGKTVKVEKTNLKSIELANGNGSAMNIVIDTDNIVEICESTFNDCLAHSGCGGGIYASFAGSGKLSVGKEGTLTSFAKCGASDTRTQCGYGGGLFVKDSGQFNDYSISSVSFASSVERNHAANGGNNVFFDETNLADLMNSGKVDVTISTNTAEYSDAMGFENGDEDYAIPLALYFIAPFPLPAVVGGNNKRDFSGCGHSGYPCSTIAFAANLRFSSLDKAILLDPTFIWSEETVMSAGEWKVKCVEKKTKIVVSPPPPTDSTSLIVVTQPATIINISFVLPLSLNSRTVLIQCDGNRFNFVNCSFSGNELNTLSYSLISANGGTFELIRCTIENMMFDFTPISASSSSAIIEACNISVAKTENGAEGGALRITLKAEQQLMINKTIGKNCECSQTIGKGGFLYVDCSDSERSAPFVFEAVVLEGNKAKIGDHLFILSNDLNTTVKSSSFMFDYSSMENSSNLFVGSDDTINNTNLFRFLVGYSNSQIHVSSLGFDVKRCGSADDPCFSFWKGMQQIDRSETKKEMIIHNKTVLKESFVLSDFKICSGTASEVEASHSTLAVRKEEQAEGKGLIRNNKSLTFSWIILSVEFVCENGEEIIVKNEDGTLSFKECWFSSTNSDNAAQNHLFVEMVKGELNADNLMVERINTKQGIVDVSDGCECSMNKLSILSSTIESGSVINVKDSDEFNRENANTVININESTFFSVSRADDGSCVCKSDCSAGVEMVVRNSSVESCKALSSEEGGAFFFLLSSDGLLRVEETRIAQCSCSVSSGRGGGGYLKCVERGELLFLFKNVTFSGNEAFVGRDIFVECTNISNQINETQFVMDLRADSYIRLNAIFGIDPTLSEPVDLMDLITIYQSATIVLSNVFGKGGANDRQCGTNTRPCLSVGYGIGHLVGDFLRIVAIDEQSEIEKEIEINDFTIQSKSFTKAKLVVLSDIPAVGPALIKAAGRNRLESVEFQFAESFSSNHDIILEIDEGSMLVSDVAFKPENVNSKASLNELVRMEGGMLLLSQVSVVRIDATTLCTFKSGTCQFRSVIVENVKSFRDLFVVLNEDVSMKEVTISNTNSQMSIISLDGAENKAHNIDMKAVLSECVVSNVSCTGDYLLVFISNRRNVDLSNCEMHNSSSRIEKGKMICFLFCEDVLVDSCIFDGDSENSKENRLFENKSEVCRWNGSFVDVVKSSVMMKDTTISNSPEGGISMRRGNVNIEMGMFANNNPFIEKYPSLRRNIICSDSASLTISSLKGGDGLMPYSSLWIQNDGCTLGGIAAERLSPFFIPRLEDVSMNKNGSNTFIKFKGSLFVPCDLSFRLIFKTGDVELVETYHFDEDSFISETEVIGTIPSENISTIADDTEVSVMILFGKQLAATSPQIVKNKTESNVKGDERIVEGGKEGKSYWLLIVIVLVVRVYDTNMQHSESSEHLLSESGSTEYILGKDSDKIPEWMLEKVEEEEIRKRTPSPSVSSTSTTDSDSTFVRGEDLCPTTSSMSNLVDAMACSSPHEKLIVDLRDSLFMLLHGRNKTKEMPIGSLKEREQTAAQILFWVANLALHSFDEMDNPLQSLANLSPHIVLFSEHMVICIVMHSDLLSDDSDSSSISSSTVVTSASVDDDESDSLPSSAFEDEDSFKKECLRWKAPELLINKKMEATKESVSFSTGMMLWECLTLQIPFGEYEAVTAGQKI
eukprot:MONOS_15404.1-p1 / transcript=MONOS_15404.1 / gene=MONOS_15404 / organism=Monocercomonoides_exilis_PA203 / gene_product=unspecified product / transcript_product=unspecified product / location=Mono_scaffold01222:6545-14473(+) / protein_length=2340 / sequence_SO=supercontig / SO=protein_coding / is_pseudo=false